MEENSLLILWTQESKEVAEKMVFMYAINSKKENWWKEVTLLLWGPSSKITAQDKDITKQIEELISNGVRVIACKQCADSYGIANILSEIGIEVFYTGIFLTEWIKSGKKIITI